MKTPRKSRTSPKLETYTQHQKRLEREYQAHRAKRRKVAKNHKPVGLPPVLTVTETQVLKLHKLLTSQMRTLKRLAKILVIELPKQGRR